MRKWSILLLACVMMMAAVPAFAQDQTIADIVVASAGGETPEFATLLAAVSAADPAVLAALSDPEQSLTVFAPTDAAFAALQSALGDEAFNAVLADQAALTDILLFHVTPGAVMSADVVAALEASPNGQIAVPSAQGQYIDIASTDGGVSLNGANLLLDMVDIQASNGIVHVIDAVILPESRTIAEIVTEMAGAADGAEFTTLLAAVSAADPAVLATLSDPEAGVTVFAPTDAAFTAAFEALGVTAEDVLADPAGLTNILLYHVIPAVVHSGDISDAIASTMAPMGEPEATPEMGAETPATPEWIAGQDETSLTVNTANGATAVISVRPNDDGTSAVYINDAQIVMTDVDASNGVIHVIDAVILPPSE